MIFSGQVFVPVREKFVLHYMRYGMSFPFNIIISMIIILLKLPLFNLC